MDGNALDKANIDNLTALWRLMGTRADSGIPGMHASVSWPNRWWFPWGKEPAAPEAHPWTRLPSQAVVPVWAAGEKNGSLEEALRKSGFAVRLEQRAMYLDLADREWANSRRRLHIARVTSPSQVESWAAVCGSAFGYWIDSAVLLRIAGDPAVRLLQVWMEKEIVATALLFKTGPVIGVHQVGVPPAYRGRGVAGTLMQDILTVCREWQGRFVTLQASAAGEGLYRKLGFVPRFKIDSYRRPGILSRQ